MRSIIPTISVEYTGLYAADHIVDLQDLGVSLHGLGRLSNSVINFYFSGSIEDRRTYHVRIFAGPPHPECVLYELFAVMQAGELPLYAKILCEMGAHFLPEFVRAIIFMTIGRRSEAMETLDKVVSLANAHAEFSKDVHDGHMQDKAWLQEHITKLSQQNRAPLRELVKPIGNSVRQIKVGSDSESTPAIVGEAEADVLSSREDLEVGELRQFRAVFDGVDTTNGSCKLRVDGDGKVFRGKITDPALLQPGNIYTNSLDTKQSVVISAKPILKEGEVVRLFISDGNSITDA